MGSVYQRYGPNGVCEDFCSRSELGTEDKDGYHFGFNNLQGRSLGCAQGDKLYWVKKIEIHNSSTANIGLRRFTRGSACWQGFCGPVFVLRTETNNKRQIRLLNMTMRDVRNAADCLSQAHRGDYDQEYLRDVKVLGTMVAPDGDCATGTKKWQEVVLNGCDGIWNSFGSAITNLLGLPLLCRTKFNPFSFLPDPELRNDEITLLYRDVVSLCVLDHVDARGPFPIRVHHATPVRPGLWEGLPGIWEGGPTDRQLCVGVRGYGSSLLQFSINTTGTAYLVRADGKPFPPQHAEALCSFIKILVEPKLAKVISGLPKDVPVAEREDILRFINCAEFKQYYDNCKAAQVANGDKSWVNLPNPYEIKNSDMTSKVKEVLMAQKQRNFEQQNEIWLRQERGEFTETDRVDTMKVLGML